MPRITFLILLFFSRIAHAEEFHRLNPMYADPADWEEEDPPIRIQHPTPLALKKDPGIALALEFFIPMAGHAYGKNIARGLLPNLLYLSSGFMLLAELLSPIAIIGSCWPGWSSSSCPVSEPDPDKLILLASLTTTGKIWSMVGSYQGVLHYNKRIARPWNTMIVPTEQGPVIAFATYF